MTDEHQSNSVGGPIGGSAESAAFFRAALAEIGETQSGLARMMKRKGDDRQPATILRTIQRMATGDARVSGEMRVILAMLLAGKRKAEKRAVEKAVGYSTEEQASGLR